MAQKEGYLFTQKILAIFWSVTIPSMYGDIVVKIWATSCWVESDHFGEMKKKTQVIKHGNEQNPPVADSFLIQSSV